MHKYQPRIHIVKRPEGASGQIVDLENEEYKTFVFPETIFTAVTAYQNQLVSIRALIFYERAYLKYCRAVAKGKEMPCMHLAI